MKFLLPLFLGLLVLTGCNPYTKLEDVANQERQKVARAYVQRLIDGDIAGLVAEVEPSLRKPETPRVFSEMRALLPPGAPMAAALVGFGGNRQPKELIVTLNYQYTYRNQWFLVSVSWREKVGAPREITGLRVQKLDRSLQDANAFTFERARPRHYAFALALVGVPVFMLVTLVTCLRMKDLPAKWAWVILIIVGVGRFTLNWSTSVLVIIPLSVQLFGVGAWTAGEYAPWIVSVSVPLGAIGFWARRWWLRRAAKRAMPAA